MKLAAAPFPVARIFSTVLTTVVWWFLLLVTTFIFAGAGRTPSVSPQVMTNVAVISLLFLPLFTTQGVLVGMLDGFLQERFTIPPSPRDAQGSPSNPWLLGSLQSLRWGVASACLAYVLANRESLAPLSAGAFALRLASFGAVLAATCAWLTTGTPFLRETRIAALSRRFVGSASRYRWTRHVLPQGLINAVINFAVAFALFPFPATQADAVVTPEIVVGDSLVTFVILTVLIGVGVRTHARVDTQWGIAPDGTSRAGLSMAAAVAPAFFASLGFTGLVAACFALGHGAGFGVSAWAVYRGLVFGLYSAWLADRVARCDFRPRTAE